MGSCCSLGLGKTQLSLFASTLPNLLICGNLPRVARWKPLCKVMSGELSVDYRKPIWRFRGVRQAIEVVIAAGTALLFSYLILQARW